MTDEQNPQAPQTGNQQVQLGIGTLIIIALIVTMCSGRSEMEKIRGDTAALRQQVTEIDRKLDQLVPKTAPPSTESVAAPADASAGPEQP